MNRKEVVRLLNDIESEYPVYSWDYDNKKVWPIIKKVFFFLWYNKQVEKDVSIVKRKRTSFFSKLCKLVSSIRKITDLILFRKSNNIERIFCGAASHRVVWKDEFINRYFEPIIEKNESNPFLEVDYGEKNESVDYKREKDIVFINDYLPILMVLVKFKNRPKSLLKIIDDIVVIFSERIEFDTILFRKHLLSAFLSINAHVIFFNILFKKYCPEKIYGLCFYNNPMFAMHFVANQNGITNFDCQHGGQGSLHAMYTFKSLPNKGLNTLPQIFWCWDEVSGRNISQWTNRQLYHEVIVKGNPWLDFQLSKSPTTVLTSRKIILYTLQEQRLDDYILNAIKNTTDDFKWWLRLHPRKLYSRSLIEEQLSEIRANNVEIEKATLFPLPILLRDCSVHISKYSGSIIEGVLINTPTIIIDEIGAEVFEDYILAGKAILILEKDENVLLDKVKELSLRKNK